MKLSGKKRIQAFALILFTAVVAYASVDGPEPGYTDAPGDLGNCTNCHDHHLPNEGPGSITLAGVPSVYEPGQAYPLTVTTAQASRIRFGFQLTALDASRRRAGTVSSLDGSTQVLPQTGFGGRQYIEHTKPGTLSQVMGSRMWQIRWTAPDTDIGTVSFFFAGNATDNSGQNNDNDYIYTGNALSDSPTSVVTIALRTQLAGQTLNAGSRYMIDWTTTGQSNIDNIELRYSTDDGMTFPITPPYFILAITDPSVNSYEWTVPNTPTTTARLRITVGKKSGDAPPPALSGRFTITAGGSSTSPPSIFSVTASGKKLFVFGENFMMGAVVEVNGVEKGTVNEENFSQALRSNKGAKKIDPGETVTVTVRNPDNTRSAPFSYTRPVE